MKRGNENKPHIGIFGKCNSGKSTLLNFLSGEVRAIVSQQSGTTTDPVRASVEVLGFAPVVMIDTAGIDDNTELGKERMAKTIETLYIVDMAIIVYRNIWESFEQDILQQIEKQGIPYLIIKNHTETRELIDSANEIEVDVLNATQRSRDAIFARIKSLLPEHSYAVPSMFGDTVGEGNVVVLVCPIDSEAPAGRLILPQVQAIRDLLDKNSITVVVQLEQLEAAIEKIGDIKMIVTDSQVIDIVCDIVGEKSPVTTFSILLAAMKGDMSLYGEGLKSIDTLQDGDTILMLESCSHQTSCEDIGRVKIPMWLRQYTSKELRFDYVTKLSALPQDLSKYALAVQCGGCMVTRRQILGRIHRVASQGVPITNYGMVISKIKI